MQLHEKHPMWTQAMQWLAPVNPMTPYRKKYKCNRYVKFKIYSLNSMYIYIWKQYTIWNSNFWCWFELHWIQFKKRHFFLWRYNLDILKTMTSFGLGTNLTSLNLQKSASQRCFMMEQILNIIINTYFQNHK
jgi:hypothetical protein